MDEELYNQACEIAKHEEKVGVMFFQRKLNIGYSQALKIINRMAKEELISPPLLPGAPCKTIR